MRLHAALLPCLVVLTSSTVLGQTAGMVNFQGLIRDSGGTPIVTTVSLEFRIFTADTGGTQVDMDGDGTLETTADAPGAGTDTILVGPLSPNGGIVSTKFGPVSPKAFSGCTAGSAACRWLEVTVVGSPPLSRLEIVTPPAAAEQVNVPQSGIPAIVTNSGGSVGVGTNTPTVKLEVAGDVKASGEVSGFGVVPLGSIQAWHKNIGSTPLPLPDGWLECNGQELPNDSPLKATYGATHTPDLNNNPGSYTGGFFLRGGNQSGTVQGGSVVFNGVREDQLGHQYRYPSRDRWIVDADGESQLNCDFNIGNPNGWFAPGGDTPHNYGHVRPVNMSVVWIIRVK